VKSEGGEIESLMFSHHLQEMASRRSTFRQNKIGNSEPFGNETGKADVI
jgi:hypothetical protein